MITLKVVTPAGVVFNEAVQIAEVRSSSGYIGVVQNRSPFVSTVPISTMYIRMADGRKVAAAIAGGIMTVDKKLVSIVSESFFFATQLDAAALEEQRIGLQKRIEEGASPDSRLDIQMEILINKIKTSKDLH